MEKYIKDGKVAALYSPEFGAGWSTWADHEYKEALVFDRELVEALIKGGKDKLVEVTKTKYPGVFTGGARDIEIMWLNPGD